MVKNRKILSLICSIMLASGVTACGTNTSGSVLESASILSDEADDINTDSYSEEYTYLTDEANLTEVRNVTYSIESFVIYSYRRVFSYFDKNRSGAIEQSELQEAPNSFAELDRDKNKKLTFTEVGPSPQRVKQLSGWINNFYNSLFNLVDKDGDNHISINELQESENLQPFNGLTLWTKSLGAISTKNRSQAIDARQFNILLNNLFLSVYRMHNDQPVPRLRGGKTPVILVQGYAEPSWYFMYGIYRDLRNNNWDAIYPVNLFPNISDIREQAKIVARQIEEAKREQGVRKVDYVAHSMGGLIGRYYIQNMGGVNSINNYVSIATPHYGTYTAWLGIGDAAKQMRPGSTFLRELNSGNPIYGSVKYTSMWTKTDEIVIPANNAILRGSRVMPDIKYTGHLLVMWAPETYVQIKDALGN